MPLPHSDSPRSGLGRGVSQAGTAPATLTEAELQGLLGRFTHTQLCTRLIHKEQALAGQLVISN